MNTDPGDYPKHPAERRNKAAQLIKRESSRFVCLQHPYESGSCNATSRSLLRTSPILRLLTGHMVSASSLYGTSSS
jgi:hypothetical protein